MAATGGTCSVPCPAPCNKTVCESTLGCDSDVLDPINDVARYAHLCYIAVVSDMHRFAYLNR